MNFLDRLINWVDQHDLFDPNEDPLLIAISGGVDSTVMAHAAKSLGWNFAMAHCNFKLRGKESDGDEVFVESLAEKWQVPFYCTQFDAKSYAREHKCSIQEAARALRYEWFERLAIENDFAKVITAHNMNDSVETAWLNFIKGTGIKGLTGIPVQNKKVVRPLLFAERSEILEYAEAHNLNWREDSSNKEVYYTRNFIRQKLLPLGEAINPSLIQSGSNSLRNLRDLERNYSYFHAQFMEEVLVDKGKEQHLPFAKIQDIPEPAGFLYDWLSRYGFTPEQTRQVVEAMDKKSNLDLISVSGTRLLVDRKELILKESGDNATLEVEVYEDDLMLRIDDQTRLVLQHGWAGEGFPDGTTEIVVASETLSFPMKIRHWQAGDSFKPFGMNGKSQKVQDFFTNLKLTALEKERTFILEDGKGRIVWIMGYRLDERFRVGPGTNRKTKISLVQLEK